MLLMKDYIAKTIAETFTALAQHEFIILKRTITQPGTLNIARQTNYTPVIATGDIYIHDAMKQSPAGVVHEGDATIYMITEHFEAYAIAPTDRINIGGIIDNGVVTSGTEYTIKDISKDTWIDGTVIVKIILEKMQWD